MTPLDYQRTLVHEGSAYTFTKSVAPGGRVERRVARSDGSVLTAQEERLLERALWEGMRAPRVAPELRAAAEAGEGRDVILYSPGDPEGAAQVVRDLGLSAADLSQRGPLPGSLRLHAEADRLSALVRATDEGRLAGLDVPRKVYPKGPLQRDQPSVADEMTWVGQNVAVTWGHFPGDGLPPGAPPDEKGIIGVYYECPRLSLGSLVASYNPRGLDCAAYPHGDAITNIIDQFITIPGRGPFTSQIAYEQENDFQEVSAATQWFVTQTGSDRLTVVNASNTEYEDGSAPATISQNDRLIDRLIASNKAIWVQATGDVQGTLGLTDYVDHLGFNTIKTAWAERNTDGSFFFNGSVKNPPSPHGDRELPEVIAPGYCGLPSEISGCAGSSAAAPVITGIVATMQSRDSNLKTSPASVRALLMMSGWKQPGAVRWSDAVGHADLADGAGIVNATDAVLGAIGSVRSWNVTNKSFQASALTGYYNDTLSTEPCTDPLGCPSGRNQPVTITFPAGGDRIKLALAWSIDDSFNDDPSRWLDLDLVLLDDHGAPVASSLSHDNNYEIIDAQVDPTRSYKLVINQAGRNFGTQEYAVAWSRHLGATNAYSDDTLSGWPALSVTDGAPSTVYSSNWFSSSANSRNTWLAAWTTGQQTIEGVVLHPRFINGVMEAFPTSYTLYLTAPDNSAWVPKGTYNAAQPQADGSVVVAVPGGPTPTYGVLIVPTVLGIDDYGNHFFQMADVSFK